MSLIMNYDKLFEPYTKDGHTLERTITYLNKVAVQHGITQDIIELAINDVFNWVANGKEFNKEKCSCGCGIDKAATDLIHTIRDTMLSIDKEKKIQYKQLLQKRYENIIADQMHRINISDKEFIKMNRLPLSERSPVLRFLKRIFKNGN